MTVVLLEVGQYITKIQKTLEKKERMKKERRKERKKEKITNRQKI